MAITMKKCPLCMGRIKDGICAECGYTIPDEEEFEQMSSLYDFEPDNYPKPDFEPMEREEYGAQVQYAEPEKPRIPSIRVVDVNTPPPSPPPHPRHNPTYYQNGQGTANNGTNSGTNQPITPGMGNNNANQPYGANNAANQPYYNQNANYGQNNSGGKQSFSISAKDIPWWELVLSLMIPVLGIVFGIKHLNQGKHDPLQKTIGTILLVLGIFRMFLL